MSTTPDRVSHPVFGELRWEAGRDVWTTSYLDAAGEWVDVAVDPGDGDRLACLDRAADLYARAIREEPRVLHDAVRDDLLELYNAAWSGGEELTADQLAGSLEFVFLKLFPGEDEPDPVLFGYAAGDLFGGHTVDVLVDCDFRVSHVNLVG